VISTEDERIKIIGEELANDTGRAIFGKISQGVSSTNELAKSLNISLPLVNWHINRLLGVGLIKVEKIELSSKNKQMKYYGPVKTAFVIVPPTNPTENNVSKSKKEAIFLQLRHYLKHCGFCYSRSCDLSCRTSAECKSECTDSRCCTKKFLACNR